MNNKTKGILLAVAALVIVVALFIPYEAKEPEPQKITAFSCSETPKESQSESTLPKVSCSQYHEKIAEKQDNLILIARPTCSFCQQFVPVLEEIVNEYGIVVNYFDTDTLNEDESKAFNQSADLFGSKDFGTPTLIITNDQKIVKYHIGYMEKDDTVNWLKDAGIIK